MSDCTKCGNQRRHVCDNCDPIADSDETNARILALEAACKVLGAEVAAWRDFSDDAEDTAWYEAWMKHQKRVIKKGDDADENAVAAKYLKDHQ